MGSLVYISCVFVVTTVPVIDSYTLEHTSSARVDYCLDEELHLSCNVRFGSTLDKQSLSYVGWNRGTNVYGRINVTAACKSHVCIEKTTDNRGKLQYDSHNDSNVVSLTLTIKSSLLQDNATFSCFAVNNTDAQTSQNISAFVKGLSNKLSYPNCSCEKADNTFTLSCMAEITQPLVVSLEWAVSGTNSTEVLSNNTMVIGDHVVLRYNTTGRHNNSIFTCRLSSDEIPCLNERICSIDPAVCPEESPPGEFNTSVSSPFSTPAFGAQSPTGFSLVMIVIITAASVKVLIILLLILVCFVWSRDTKMKRTQEEGTRASSTTTASRRRHQNVFEDVNIYILPDGERMAYEVVSDAPSVCGDVNDDGSHVVVKTPSQTAHNYEVLGSDETEKSSSYEGATCGEAALPGALSLVYEVVPETPRVCGEVNDNGSHDVVKKPSQAEVYEVLESDETERAIDNEGATCRGRQVVVNTSSQAAQIYEVLGLDEMEKSSSNEEGTRGGCQDVVKTPNQAAPVYEVLESDEAETSMSNEGATHKECNVPTQGNEPFVTEDQGKAEEAANKGAGSPRSFTLDSEEGKLIDNVWYMPYKETRMTE